MQGRIGAVFIDVRGLRSIIAAVNAGLLDSAPVACMPSMLSLKYSFRSKAVSHAVKCF